jgi:16S rRNA (cytosine967-C5)-methyltransferase
VIRRHPDIKVLRRPADVAAAVRLQAELLRALWPLL